MTRKSLANLPLVRVDVHGRHGWKSAVFPMAEVPEVRFIMKRLVFGLVRTYDATKLELTEPQITIVQATVFRILQGLARGKSRASLNGWQDERVLQLRVEDRAESICLVIRSISETDVDSCHTSVDGCGRLIYATAFRKLGSRS